MALCAGNRDQRPDDSFNISLHVSQCHTISVNTSKSHRIFVSNRSQHRSAGSDAFKLLPLVTLSGPGEGLPQALCGPLLADDACGELKMRIDVRVGAIRCFSAPQTRSASLPRRLRCHCSRAPLPAFPRPSARSRPFDPAAVRKSCLFAPLHDSLCGCCCSQGKGRRRRERAGSSCTILRHDKDDDRRTGRRWRRCLSAPSEVQPGQDR